MATKRYLDVRYDVTGLDDDEIGQLALEATVQAESSSGHPSVEVESETVEVEDDADDDRLRAALERAHDRSYLKLGDADLDVYYEEVVRGLGIAEPVALVGNVIFDEGEQALRLVLGEADNGVVRDGSVWFHPYLSVFDPDDPGDGPLFVMYAAEDGSGATVYAPACGDANELERRLTRAFGDSGWTLDDHGQAVRAGAKNLAHAGESCSDPDCEIHHPGVIDDANERLTALAWFEAGRQSAQAEPPVEPPVETAEERERLGVLPTSDELEAARKRLAPYLGGYPEPMIDARRLRIANGTASAADVRAVRAEDALIRRLRTEGP